MKDFVFLISKLWKEELSDRYILYLDTHEVASMPDGLVFGNNFKLLSDESVAQFGIDELLDISRYCYPVHKMAVLNRELIYYCNIDDSDGVKIRIAISSLIYGRSNRHVMDLVQESSGSWRINMEQHSLRANDSRCRCKLGNIFLAGQANSYYYDGFRGSLDDCIERVYQMEKDSEDPYASMKNDRDGRQRHDDAMKTDIELKIRQGCLSINNYFSI